MSHTKHSMWRRIKELPHHITRAVYEYQYAKPNEIAAHFHLSLVSAFFHADSNNRQRLAHAFPEYTEAISLWNQGSEEYNEYFTNWAERLGMESP